MRVDAERRPGVDELGAGLEQRLAGVFVAVVLVIKLVRETELLGFGSYSGVLAGLLVAYGGYAISREGADAA